MKALIEQIMIDFVPQLDGANMNFQILGEQKLHVEIDIELIVRLLENIINNSIMYGKDGKEILILFQKEISNVEIEIKNFGQCIPNENFLTFLKSFIAGKITKSYTGGKGMGLAIARSIAELHKGDITVHSNDKETVFTIVLPQY